MNMFKKAGILAIMTLSVMTPAIAQDGGERADRKVSPERIGRDAIDSDHRPSPRLRALEKGGARYKAFLKKFDTDKDGKLSKKERAKAREMIQRLRAEKRAQMKKIRSRYMEKFDTNGDGKLSEEEKQNGHKEARAQMAGIKQNFTRLYDSDGDGELSKAERKVAHQQEKRKMLERFDRDGNGALNAAEKKAAFDSMLEHEPHRLMHAMRGAAKGRKVPMKGRGAGSHEKKHPQLPQRID